MAANHQCHQHRDIAKSLVNYLVEYYHLDAPQLSPVSNTNQNPTDPNEWNWVVWHDRHYVITAYGDFKKLNKTQFREIVIEINRELGCGELFKPCKELPAIEDIGKGRVHDCENFYALATLYDQQLKALTPLIQDCIRTGLFTRSFINKLYEM